MLSFDDRRKLTTGEEIVEDILNDVLDRIELEAAKAELNRLKSKKKTLKKKIDIPKKTYMIFMLDILIRQEVKLIKY